MSVRLKSIQVDEFFTCPACGRVMALRSTGADWVRDCGAIEALECTPCGITRWRPTPPHTQKAN